VFTSGAFTTINGCIFPPNHYNSLIFFTFALARKHWEMPAQIYVYGENMGNKIAGSPLLNHI
jgi:hypothetical protein